MESIIDYHMNRHLKRNELFLLIVLVLLILLVIFACKFKYKSYVSTTGVVVVNNENYYIDILVPKDNFQEFINLNNIFINDNLVPIKIIDISKSLVILENENFYIIQIETMLEEFNQIENNILNVQFYYKDEILIKKIIEIIGG